MLPFRNRKTPKIIAEKKITAKHIQFAITDERSRENHVFRFPLDSVPVSSILSSPDAQTIATLELLFFDEILQEDDSGRYILTYDQFYELEPEIRSLLKLPSHSENLEAKLNCEGSVGTEGFKFQLDLFHPKHGYILKFGQVNGPFVSLLDGTILLMEKSVYKLMDAIERYPTENVAGEEKLRSFAEVKKRAEEAGAQLSNYLKMENYTFLDEVQLDVILQDGESLELVPRIPANDEDADFVDEMISRDCSYMVLGNQPSRRRIVLSNQTKNKIDKIKSLPNITGEDMPRFLLNPAAFIPDDMEEDLEKFSERVKRLGIRVYQPRIYTHVTSNKRNWFHTGVKITDDQGEIIDEFDVNDFQEKYGEAIKKGEEFVRYDGGWTKLPHKSDWESFIQADQKVRTSGILNGPCDGARMSMVLEIFENIEQLEFNKPLLELKASLEDSGILDAPPDLFKGKLYPYQVEGFRWLKLLEHRNSGGLLADDMGLGKTVQVIAFLSFLKEKNQLAPSLIIAPLTLLHNWKRELLHFCPSIGNDRVYVHQGSNRIRSIEDFYRFDIVLTSYETLVRDQIILGQVDWVCVISDEAQKFKNSSTATSHAVKAMKNKFRLAMTGTPVENGLTELWSIMDYVQPGLLGSLNQFKKRFEQPILSAVNEEQINRVEDELLSIIQPVYKRRKKLEVLGESLPRKLEPIREFVELGPEQADLYRQTIREVKSGELEVLPALNRLRQICSHPGLCDDQYDDLPLSRVPKLASTLEWVREIAKKKEKVLIFTFYKKMQLILSRWIMREFGVHPPIINGETHSRQWIVDQFNEFPGFNAMILSQQAAGVGLNIVGANHVIHYTRWWNPAIENQATDRVYRIGQKKDVNVYYPIVKVEIGKSMEEHLDDLLNEKKELADRVLVPSVRLDCNDELIRRLRSEVFD